MINRVLLRIKILQMLYAHYKGDGNSVKSTVKELFHSIEKTYELYFHLFQLSVEVTRYAEQKIDSRKNKLHPSEEDLNPNTRFIDNAFVKQVAQNKCIQDFLSEHKISWANNQDTVKLVYDLVVESIYYAEYMNKEKNDYPADKDIWRKIFTKIILPNEDFYDSIEEQSIYWTDDLDIVVSFVIKTIKRFTAENGKSIELLPMFKDNEDKEFALDLIQNAIKNEAEYRTLIDDHTRNWELDRIAFMDILIMQLAIAEIMTFPTIPINVTLNEYIEISKSYSTQKSGNFINGILDNIVKELKSNNKVIKVVKI
ncbi:MAG: transcription antitermination factor NusB [Porphyromonadaceae bacterium]|nr:transcription antitermination factor NusB [Porphyromonadaceae bacterium]